jgi:hypothetical protein
MTCSGYLKAGTNKAVIYGNKPKVMIYFGIEWLSFIVCSNANYFLLN